MKTKFSSLRPGMTMIGHGASFLILDRPYTTEPLKCSQPKRGRRFEVSAERFDHVTGAVSKVVLGGFSRDTVSIESECA